MNMLQEIDLAVLDAIQSGLRCGIADQIMAAVSLIGAVGWAVCGILLLFFKKYRFCGAAVLIAFTAALLLTELAVKPLFLRERPYLLNPEIVLAVPEPYGTSFPSAHSSTSFAAAAALFRGKKLWGILGICFAALVAFSRLYLYVHFPSDVLAGTLLGAGIGLACLWLSGKAEKAFYERKRKK